MLFLDEVQYKNQIPVINCRFRAILLLELGNTCKTIKKTDYRRISNKLILDNWDFVANILLEILNKLLETEMFPNNWKESLVTSIEKTKKY